MKVIFNGDDFGLTRGINQGIIRAFRNGLLSSASLAAAGEAFDDAVSLAAQNPGLDVGIHLVLTGERPVLPPQNLASITFNGAFSPTWQKVFLAALTRKIDGNRVEKEWCAQIEKCLDAGVALSHMDGHQFVHLFPALFQIALDLAVRYRIKYVRTALYDRIDFKAGAKRLAELLSMKFWNRIFVSSRLRPSVETIPALGFLHAGGRMKKQTLLSALDAISRKNSFRVVEFVLHPAMADVGTAKKYAHWRYAWHRDLELLQDAHLAQTLKKREIEITSFRELA